MASRPLGEVGVAVDGSIDPLLKKFAAAESAADAFYKRMTAKLSRVPVGGGAAGSASNDNAARAADRMGQSLARAEKAGARYHQTLIQINNDNRTIIQIVDQSTRTFNNQRTAIDASSRSLTNITNNYRRAGEAAGGMERETRRAGSAASDLRRTLMQTAGVIVGAFGVNEVKNLADGYTRFTNQLKVAGLEGGQLADTQERLFGQAQRYGVDLESLGGLYGRLAQSQRELGATSGQVLQFTNGVAAAIKIQGAGTEAARGALTQLSQALGGTIVRAEEYNSINEGARPILQAVANGIDRFGGSIAKLRAEVVEGKVSSQEFFQGFLRGSAQLEQQAARANLTLGASFQTLNNALGRYIGQTDQSLSATQRIGAGIKLLADNLDVIVPILTSIIIAMGSRYLVAAGAFVAGTNLARVAVLSFEAVLLAMQGRALASIGTLVGVGTAARAAGASLLRAFGGPVGIAIAGIAAAVYYFYQRQQQAAAQTRDFNQHQKEAKELLANEAINARIASGAIKGLGDAHGSAAKQIREFAGATGDAAVALEAQARANRRARFEALAKGYNDANRDRDAARQLVEDNAPRVNRAGVLVTTPEYRAAQERLRQAQARLDAIGTAINEAIKTPLDSDLYAGAFRKTGGRDIPREIKQYQDQLTKLGTSGNEIARRQLLDEIKLRQRILQLMKTGLSLEIAQATASAEKLKKPGEVEDGARRLGRPVQGGTIRGTVGEKRPGHTHAGTDYAVPVGTPVSATAGGTVIEAGTLPGYGNVVIIDHGRGLTTRYAHLSRIGVAKGASVSQGDQIGLSGGARGAPGAGNSRGPHLHYEVRKGGKAVDPNGLYATDEVDAANKAEQLANQRVQRDQTFGAAQQQLNDLILAEREKQLVSEEEIARATETRINGERDRERDEIENRRKRGEYSVDSALNDARAAELTTANENLRTAQLAGVKLKERQRLEESIARTLSEQHDRELERLQLDQDMARTASERRAVERRILANQKEFERQSLQAIIDSQFTKPEDRERAQRDKDSLDERYDRKGRRIDREAIEEMYGLAPDDSEIGTRDRQRQAERERDDKLGTLDEATNILVEEAETQEERERILREAAERRVAIEMEAAKRIMDLEIKRKTLQLQNAQDIADGLAQIAEGIAGKQSGIYRGLFATAKAFAIAQAAIALYQNVAEAMKFGFPQNLPFIAGAVAQGATIMANIQAISGAGFQRGGFTGHGADTDVAGAVHRNEYVFDAAATRRIGRSNLDSIRAGRDPTAGLRRQANDNGGLAAGMSQQRSRVLVKQMPGVAIEYRENFTTGDIEMIAERAVDRRAPSAVARDMEQPNGKVRKAMRRTTTARDRKS